MQVLSCIASFFLLFTIKYVNCNEIQRQTSTDLAQGKIDRLLLFATLEGTLIAIEQQTGRIRWRIKEKPMVQVPVDTTNAIVPIFLPDPRDGSLYLLGSNKEPLKKLPFTIPQLVATSPCRSSDGILYTGKKKDSWFKLDPNTGNKEEIMGWTDAGSSTCPVLSKHSIYIGRTKYTVMMVDSTNPIRKWNITYYEYTAKAMSKEEINNYDLVHFSSSSTGHLITMDRRRGTLLWDSDLGSPIVAAYILDTDGLLIAPFTSLANHTLAYLTTNLLEHNQATFETHPHRMKLYPTLYVGDHLYGLYAIPSLVDQNVVTITASDDGPLLLGGPNAPELPRPYPDYPIPGYNYHLPQGFYENKDQLSYQRIPNFIIFIGHYNIPKYSDNRFLISEHSTKYINLITDESNKFNKKIIEIEGDCEEENIKRNKTSNFFNLKAIIQPMKKWVNQQENKGLKLMLIILIGCVISMFWYLQMQVREFQNLSQNSSKSSTNNQQQINNMQNSLISYTEELPNGFVRIGKITFNPKELLGKGCEGTFVYNGEFDNRKVAVKRLLPECFTFADREVALLRESDAHPNVIRYYCMEQDRMFRYIALELCQATLYDYVQGTIDKTLIEPLDILRQATAGLAHLHSLDIVHRDIKPHNVLLSVPNNRSEVKAMISDFGLCKKLQVGRVSFSRRSGVTGTDGWIAPEMLNSNERTTFAVDLFSLGCLYYYVLSNGYHPFGDALRRQANILNNEFNLNDLLGDLSLINLQKPLISALIGNKPDLRPHCTTVLQHPMFWDNAKILAFFQDVSDRVEKCDDNDNVLVMLETNCDIIIKCDWRLHIHDEVASDLRKYRSYKGDSVRDLLRALRNKKHHFRELADKAQEYLGEIPNAFTKYWTSRFPLLLVHTWITMQCVGHEVIFQQYYPKNYSYSLKQYQEQIIEFVNEYPLIIDTEHLEQIRKRSEMEMYQSSPKRSVKFTNFYETNLRRRFVEDEPKNVGLYRNLPPNFKADKKFLNGNNKKRASKSDEPLVWALKE